MGTRGRYFKGLCCSLVAIWGTCLYLAKVLIFLPQYHYFDRETEFIKPNKRDGIGKTQEHERLYRHRQAYTALTHHMPNICQAHRFYLHRWNSNRLENQKETRCTCPSRFVENWVQNCHKAIEWREHQGLRCTCILQNYLTWTWRTIRDTQNIIVHAVNNEI